MIVLFSGTGKNRFRVLISWKEPKICPDEKNKDTGENTTNMCL